MASDGAAGLPPGPSDDALHLGDRESTRLPGPYARTYMTSPVLAFDRAGNGEPLLLLHGLGSARGDFAQLTPLLTPHFDVISVDLPGHGQSPPAVATPTVTALADIVTADLDTHGLDRVHVLGNSLGGRLAIELAKRGRALSVVAISPSGLGLPAERLYQGAMMSTGRLINRSIGPLIPSLARSATGRSLLLAGLRAKPWKASVSDALTVLDGFATADGFWPMLWSAVITDVPTGLGEVNVPVLLAQGTFDVVGCGQTPRYLALISGATFQPLVGAGHAPQSDAPQQIVELVRRAVHRAGGRLTHQRA